MRFSIKFSVLSIILSLLISISLVSYIVYHYTVNNILLETSKNSLKYACEQVSEEVEKYFLPLRQLSFVGAGLIQDGSITPGNTPEFINFLYNMVITDNDIRQVFYTDVAGNFYLINQAENYTHFTYKSRINSGNNIKQIEAGYDGGYFSNISTNKL